MVKQHPSHERNRNGTIHGLTIGACIQITDGKHKSSILQERGKFIKQSMLHNTELNSMEHSDFNLLLSDSNNGIPKILYTDLLYQK